MKRDAEGHQSHPRRAERDVASRPRRPEWFKIRLRTDGEYRRVNHLVSELSLNTVCTEARCPNIYECWSQGTATFMILGDVCTRHCGFCSVTKGKPLPPDPREPIKVAEAVAALGLDYAVITSVDRDDLPDEGARHWAETVRAIKRKLPECEVELLIPDFNGNKELLEIVLEAGPDVIGHNVETVAGLYRRVRPVADYTNSLKILEQAYLWREQRGVEMAVKCGIMVGLGETMEQVLDTMRDIAGTGCEIMTVGQYLPPKKNALPLARYYTPEEFDFIRDEGMKMGLKHIESGPLVRSSYRAKTQAQAASQGSPTAQETG
jgi:lipoic acid synthetase